MTTLFINSESQLTAEELEKVNALRASVADFIAKDKSLQQFCSLHTYVRFLSARKWNVEKASKLMMKTLQWRVAQRPEEIRFSDVEEDALSGKIFLVQGADKTGRLCMVMRPKNENCPQLMERQLKYVTYVMEKASNISESMGQCKICVIIDCVGYSQKNAPNLRISKQTLGIMEQYYPERLGSAVVFRAHKVFGVLWKLLQPFLDPVTKNKVMLIPNGSKQESEKMTTRFNMDYMEELFGGKVPSYTQFEQSVIMMQENDKMATESAKLYDINNETMQA